LADRSNVPHHCPHLIAPAVEALLIAERVAHPFSGAQQLLAILRRRHPRRPSWPAASTVADPVARRGLMHQRHRRRKPVHPGVVRPVTDATKLTFEHAFRAYGIPLARHTDNGVPFATQAIHGLSHLNIWWMR